MAEIKSATLLQTIEAVKARDGEHTLATIVAQLDPDSRSASRAGSLYGIGIPSTSSRLFSKPIFA